MERKNARTADDADTGQVRTFRYRLKDIRRNAELGVAGVVLGTSIAHFFLHDGAPHGLTFSGATFVGMTIGLYLGGLANLSRGAHVSLSQSSVTNDLTLLGRSIRWDAVYRVRIWESPRGETRKIKLTPLEGRSVRIHYFAAIEDIRALIEERLKPTIPFRCRRQRLDWYGPSVPLMIIGVALVFLTASLIW